MSIAPPQDVPNPLPSWRPAPAPSFRVRRKTSDETGELPCRSPLAILCTLRRRRGRGMAFEPKDALQLSEQRLQLALAVGKLGSWQLTLPERTLTASAQCKANHGLPPDASLTLEGITDAIRSRASRSV